MAEWEFESTSKSTEIDSVATILEKILLELERLELIISRSVILTLREMVYYKEPQKFDTEFFKSIINDDRGSYIEIFSDGFLYKLEEGKVTKEAHHRVVNISLMYDPNRVHTLIVSTNSYVWLPFDLLGQPQPQYYSVNAIRLPEALAYVENLDMLLRRNGIVEKPYCMQSGYFLMNYFDTREHNGIESFILV